MDLASLTASEDLLELGFHLGCVAHDFIFNLESREIKVADLLEDLCDEGLVDDKKSGLNPCEIVDDVVIQSCNLVVDFIFHLFSFVTSKHFHYLANSRVSLVYYEQLAIDDLSVYAVCFPLRLPQKRLAVGLNFSQQTLHAHLGGRFLLHSECLTGVNVFDPSDELSDLGGLGIMVLNSGTLVVVKA